MKKAFIFACFFVVLSANCFAKNIFILATGGTISGSAESEIESKYKPSKIDISQIVKSVPKIDKVANLQAEQLLQVSSQNISGENWIEIAKRADEILKKSEIDGLVITHGTDTMEETAYFLHLVLKSQKPIVVTGSMRPSSSISADGPLNLFNAISLAASKKAFGKGVLILMNDEIFSARDAVKKHSTNAASFKSNDFGSIGFVNYGRVEIYYQPLRLHTKDSAFKVKDFDKLPKVDIIYAHSSSDANIVDYLVSSGSKAIVVAGVGDGNVNDATLAKLSLAQKSGILVVRSSRGGSGFVEPNAEIDDEEFGFVSADNLSAQKARILAALALGKTNDVKKIREFFAKY